MIFASVIRQGGLAVVRPAAINNSKTAIIRSIGSTATSSTPVSQQKRGQSYLSASTNNSSTIAAKNTNNLIVNTPLSSWRRQNSKLPIQQLVCQLSSSYHTSIPALQADAAIAKDNEEGVESKIRSIPPDIRAIILADLKAVDADGNGRIDHEELKTLLRKYNNAFTEASILELSELFYTSLGASSVDIGRFMEALDAAAADLGTSGGGDSVGGERIPLATKGQFKTHALGIGTCASEYTFNKTHGKYTEEDLNIEITHVPPVTRSDRIALFAVKCVRLGFDTATLWNFGSVTKNKILNRAIFLETIAAIPGMVAAIIRHFRSLRHMQRDGGLLNMFLEEANNERMHLLTFIKMKDPGRIFRSAVIVSQFGFGAFFFTAYMISPQWCHKFIGYVEEEACHTYTKILDEFDKAEPDSELDVWKREEAPKIAKGYWYLGEEGTVYDVMRAVRADEAEHRDVNHAVSGAVENPDAVNPLYDPRVKLDGMLRKYVQDIMEREAKK